MTQTPQMDNTPVGSSEGPATSETGRGGRKRSGGTAPSDDDVAAYAAARGFLLAEWFGAGLMVASFTLLYLLAFGAHASPALTYAVCAALLAVGALVFLRSRAYYARIGADIAPRSHGLAAVVAGSAGIFWLLFLLLVGLAWLGVPLQ
jgi:hypothetical protein